MKLTHEELQVEVELPKITGLEWAKYYGKRGDLRRQKGTTNILEMLGGELAVERYEAALAIIAGGTLRAEDGVKDLKECGMGVPPAVMAWVGGEVERVMGEAGVVPKASSNPSSEPPTETEKAPSS